MGKIRWMGKWEKVRENESKFEKYCVLDTYKEEKLLTKFESKIPESCVLWTFITNPRGVLFPIENEILGYQNTDYMNWWQAVTQNMWEIFSERFGELIPIVSLKEVAHHGLYYDDSLPEQFPGDYEGVGINIVDYPVGDFEDRDYGGWKWFSLIIDYDLWKKEWETKEMPKMGAREQLKHDAAPKYYKPYYLSNGKMKLQKDAKALYSRPKDVRFINRRFSFPWVIAEDVGTDTAKRYEKASDIIINKLGTRWTLGVWNGINLEYSPSRKSTTLIIRPEITISLGRYSTKSDGHKRWGKEMSHLHRYWDKVYWVKVGLPKKARIELETEIKSESNPLWDGDYTNLWEIMRNPYKRLLGLAITQLKGLME